MTPKSNSSTNRKIADSVEFPPTTSHQSPHYEDTLPTASRSESSTNRSENTPIFIFKRHAALAMVKDVAQLHRNILAEINRYGLTDYSFGVMNPLTGLDTPLTTTPNELIERYQSEGFYQDDQSVGYLLANSRPIYRTTIEHHIETSPVETKLVQRNRELISMWRNFGYLESYLIPVDEDGTTLTVTARNEPAVTVQRKVKGCTEELSALGKVIRHVCLRKFPDVLSPDKAGSAPVEINKRPLEVLSALANGCPTVYAVAAELGISINTANHHIATAKTALRATSLPHAIAIAIRRGLV